MEEEKAVEVLNGYSKINKMEKWQIIASEFFPEEYEKYKSTVYISRNPKNIKFTTIDKDVLRRDLTFNALFYDLDKQEIIDLVGGIDDIKNKITRFVGDPATRITEDPLRILRLFRFATRYDFNIDEKSFLAIKALSFSLSIITKERIWDEIKKAYKQANNFLNYINLLIDSGVAEVIFPDVHLNEFLINFWYHKNISLEVYFAKLFSNNKTNELTNKMIFELKMDTVFTRKVIFLIDLLSLNESNILEIYKKKSVSAISTNDIIDWYRIIGLIKYPYYRAFLYFKPSVSANELMKKGFKDKALGKEIKRLETLKFKELLNEV